jgi:hypothetical protein
VPGVAGFSLAASLKPDGVKAGIGVALYRLVLSPDGSKSLAKGDSGGILVNGVYSDPRFKDTTYTAWRANLARGALSEWVMLNLVMPNSTTQPDFAANVQKVSERVLPVKGALVEIQ